MFCSMDRQYSREIKLKHIREKRQREVQRIVGELMRLRHAHVLKAECAQIDHIYERVHQMQVKRLLPEVDIEFNYGNTEDSSS